MALLTCRGSAGHWTAGAGPARWTALLGLAAGVHAAGLAVYLGGAALAAREEPKELHVLLKLEAEEAVLLPAGAAYRGASGEAQPPRALPAGAPMACALKKRMPHTAPAETDPRATLDALTPAIRAQTVVHAVTDSAPCAARSASNAVDGADAPLALTASVSSQPPSTTPAVPRNRNADGWDAAIARQVARSGGSPESGRAALSLPGKPDYPRSCRGGICRNGSPCQGTGRWRLTVLSDGAEPAKVERLASAGCALLDASTVKFLKESAIPEAGTFEVVLRFQIEPE